MVRSREFSPPRAVHLELFVTPRAARGRIRRYSRELYRVVRPRTRRQGGAGPFLFLLEANPPPRQRPERLREAIGVRPTEDLWLELAFYAGAKARRRTLRNIWALPVTAQLAQRVESLTKVRRRSWTLANGELQSV